MAWHVTGVPRRSSDKCEILKKVLAASDLFDTIGSAVAHAAHVGVAELADALA